MDKIFLMDALQPFHNFYDHLNRMVKGECAILETGLIGEEVSLLTVLHDDNNEVIC